ncbi:hypothetical protein IHE45_08G072100 [Dioscorea alata]|uniref:Uncharacterized protein n=1 Tax=Dioscorea alata TaxID=55571 RepID=A0ACB7VK25_DIOAL|nr:hypothetical protein IHE45_08G072100 [Dioscorea alata]
MFYKHLQCGLHDFMLTDVLLYIIGTSQKKLSRNILDPLDSSPRHFHSLNPTIHPSLLLSLTFSYFQQITGCTH